MEYLKKFNEEDMSELEAKMKEFELVCEKTIMPEIENIKFILEDEGNEVYLIMGGEPGLPPGLYISIKHALGKISNKLKRKSYNIIYQEFMDRIEEICEQSGCYITILESLNYDNVGVHGLVAEVKFGYIFKILPIGVKLSRGYVSYRKLML